MRETYHIAPPDYHPFGMRMFERSSNSSKYRYGFNSQENTDEIAGEGNHTTALFWEYDTRTARRWNQDPKPNPLVSNYATFANNPILYSDMLGDTVRNRHTAEYQGKGIEYSYSAGGESQQIGEYTVTPYYDANDKLVGYGAGRQDGKGNGVEYYLDAGDLSDFETNIDNYTLAADFFYMNGVPSEGMIALAAGDTWNGLKMQWKEALSDPSYYLNIAMMYAGMRVVKGGAVARQGKWKFTSGNYKYEVRSHLRDPNAPIGSNSANGPTYRVSRQSTLRNGSGQGSGREYRDIHGNWHRENTLRQTNRDGTSNPSYNPAAANETHIPNKF